MELERASATLAAASEVTLLISGARVRLKDLTPNQADLVRASRARGGTWSYGRKYFKLLDSLTELEKLHSDLPPFAVSSSPGYDPVECGGIPPHAVGAQDTRASTYPSNTWALVPYVPTARPDATVLNASDNELWQWPLRAIAAYTAACRNTAAWRLYAPVCRLLLKLFLYLPLLLAWLLLFYCISLLWHLITHPELVVFGLFKLLDLAPQYISWAGQQMLLQLTTEITARFR